MKETRNSGNPPGPEVILILASRIPVLQVPRSSVDNPTTENTKKNAEQKMPNVMNVVRLVTSRNVARN